MDILDKLAENIDFIDIRQKDRCILDMPTHCLELMFRYLDMENLFSVSLANSNFINTAALVFKRKYNGITIKVHPHQIYAFTDENRSIERFKLDWVQPFNEFAFLRIFGNSITKLHIVSYVGSEMVNAIKSYVSKYCTQGIVTIEFKLYSRWPTYRTKYQYLDCLNDKSCRDLCNQLPTTVRNLCLRCGDCSFSGRNSFVPESLKELSLMIPLRWSFEPPPITFPNLKLLELRGMFMTIKWLHFITQNSNLIKLDLISFSTEQFSNDWLIDLVKALPKLKVLAINETNINLKFIAKFLCMCRTLKQLRLYTSRWDSEISFRTRFNTRMLAKIEENWDVYAGSGCAVFVRKISIIDSK